MGTGRLEDREGRAVGRKGRANGGMYVFISFAVADVGIRSVS